MRIWELIPKLIRAVPSQNRFDGMLIEIAFRF